MAVLLAHMCVAWLICGYCTVIASWPCRDFSNFDVCEDSDVDSLRMTFGECNVKIHPRMAEQPPVVKYDNVDRVCSASCVEVIKRV